MTSTATPGATAPAPRRGVAGPGAPVELDDVQRRVAEHPRGAGPLVVVGAPGSGRTTALVEALVTRVERDGADPASLLVLAPSRRAAAALRDRLSSRLGRTTTEALARTPHSYAWSLLHRAALATGGEPPRLLSGPEQDQVLAELLRGHDDGVGVVPPWPEGVTEQVRALPAFRAELRDLLMRALEHGLGPADLARHGHARGRPEWVSAAQVLAEYLQVTALASPGAHDPAAIVHDAASALLADPALLAAERARLTLVVVDDHHESTAATAALLDLVAGGGADLLLAGDPDATTTTFRGGDPRLLADAPRRFGGRRGAAPVVLLPTRWRSAHAVAAASQRVAARTGSVGLVAHRGASPPSTAPDGLVEAHLLGSTAQQWAAVAGLLREEHLRHGTPWSQMAVVLRTTGGTGGLRRALAGAGVPVVVPPAEVPVRSEPAVAPLLLAMRLALAPTPGSDAGAGAGPGGEPVAAVDDVLALLGSPLGRADPLAVRRLRQVLLAAERVEPPAGGPRDSDALLVDLVREGSLDTPARAALPEGPMRPARRVAKVLDAGRAAARGGGSAEEVLWALWATTGLASRWRTQALGGGPGAALADRDLDAVVALFDAASRYEEREPGSPPQRFLEHLQAQDVPADSLAARAAGAGAVELLTPTAAAGREFDVVVVPGLQEGAWPDTRLRGSLLGAPDLADVLAGRAEVGAAPAAAASAARRQVLDDEHRLLQVAVSRARRRLVVTAVRSEDERPSGFVDLVCPFDPPADAVVDAGSDAGSGPVERPLSRVARTMALPPLVAELRGVLLTATGARGPDGVVVDEERRTAATAALARLARAGVPGADPSDWYGLVGLSDDRPLRAEGEPVPVRPSAVESFDRCGLRWVLEGSGGKTPRSLSQGVGVLVHRIAQELPEGTREQMAARLDELWPQLGLPPTWVGQRERHKAEQMVGLLADYVALAREQGRTLVDVEVDVDAALGRALVKGRLDRLERDPDGALRVVDLKTGTRAPRADEVDAHPQLGVYQALVEAGAVPTEAPGPDREAEDPGGPGPVRSGGAALVQLGGSRKKPSVQVQVPLAQADDPGWARTLLERTADGMAASAFEAVANDLCTRCPVRTSCPLRPEGGGVA